MNWKEAESITEAALLNIYSRGEAAAIADWVVEHLSGLKKADRLIKERTLVKSEQQEQLQHIMRRLEKAEPVQYVLQEAWFGEYKFYVDKHVLIPRPETEELVEWVIKECRFPVTELHILDVGCGSGCIPVSLKRRIRKAEVWACDISLEAIAVAKKNALQLGASVHFITTDFLNQNNWHQFPRFDIITSNPPYIPEQDKLTMHANVLAFEPHSALFVPDTNPLLFYEALAGFGKTHLNPGGSLFMEIHEKLGSAVLELLINAGYQTELRQDMQGKDRMIKAVLM